MRTTYDASARAMYVYFTEAWNGHSDTLTDLVTEFDFDDAGQIIALRVYERDEEGETYFFGDKLTFALQNPNVSYDNEYLEVRFATDQCSSTVAWETNIDLDGNSQIVGVEVLFSPIRLPDRGLDHILKMSSPAARDKSNLN